METDSPLRSQPFGASTSNRSPVHRCSTISPRAEPSGPSLLNVVHRQPRPVASMVSISLSAELEDGPADEVGRQQRLNFRPLPHGQGALRLTRFILRTVGTATDGTPAPATSRSINTSAPGYPRGRTSLALRRVTGAAGRSCWHDRRHAGDQLLLWHPDPHVYFGDHPPPHLHVRHGEHKARVAIEAGDPDRRWASRAGGSSSARVGRSAPRRACGELASL